MRAIGTHLDQGSCKSSGGTPVHNMCQLLSQTSQVLLLLRAVLDAGSYGPEPEAVVAALI